MSSSIAGRKGDKDVVRFLRTLERDHGCAIVPTRSNHVRVTAPNGAVTVTGTGKSERRRLQSLRSWARQHGGIAL